MLAQPPNDPTKSTGHISIAWPVDGILDVQGNCVGFLMPTIDHQRTIPLLKLYNPKDRRLTAPDFTWRYLLRTAGNIAITLAALHTKGYVVGDLNESNILVSMSALITIVDCDSMQVPYADQKAFRCTVGKAEYTPPELQGCDFRQINRAPWHDNFALAVIIFLLLMEGNHPFMGIWQGNVTRPIQTIEQNIRAGAFPYTRGSSPTVPPRGALPFDTLPPTLQVLMQRSFVESTQSPNHRPTAHDWYTALSDAESQLTTCRVNSQHWYSNHLQECPWCQRIRMQGVPDPYPFPTQQPLPPLRSSSSPSTLSASSSSKMSFPPKSVPTIPSRLGGNPTISASTSQSVPGIRGCIKTLAVTLVVLLAICGCLGNRAVEFFHIGQQQPPPQITLVGTPYPLAIVALSV